MGLWELGYRVPNTCCACLTWISSKFAYNEYPLTVYVYTGNMAKLWGQFVNYLQARVRGGKLFVFACEQRARYETGDIWKYNSKKGTLSLHLHKARVSWADLSPVRLFWRVLSDRVNHLSGGTDLTVSAGQLAKKTYPLSHFLCIGQAPVWHKKTGLSGHGP